jgi:hypothetical protein
MPSREPDDELFAAALAASNVCPPLEQLERLLGDGAPARLKQHVDGCLRCQTELQMLRSFSSGEVADRERAAVESIATQLRARSSELVARRAPAEQHRSWWKTLLAAPWLTPAAAMAAVVLVVAGVAIEVRQGRKPGLNTAAGEAEVLRSSSIAILSPIGDLQEQPGNIRWEPVPNAAVYRVRIMEVDGAELWNGETTTPRIDLPPRARTFIVPAKTLLIQVAAFDAAGRKLGESEPVRFRFLQKLYRP